MTLNPTLHPLTIIMYHSISSAGDHYSVHPDIFHKQMEAVSRTFPVIPLPDVPDRLKLDFTERAVVITFDDAFEDFTDQSLPVLEHFRIPATLFVPTGFIGGDNAWDRFSDAIASKSLLSKKDLKAIARSAQVNLGSHSVDHVRISRLAHDRMIHQVSASKSTLEEITGKPVDMFAYPFGRRGDYSPRSADILRKAGYRLAVTSSWGTTNSTDNLFALKRITLPDSPDIPAILKTIEGGRDRLERLKENTMYHWRRLKNRRPGRK